MSYLVKESDIIDVNYDLWKLNLKEYLRRRGRVPPSFLTTLPVPFPFVTSSRHAAQRHSSSTSQSTPLWTKIYSTRFLRTLFMSSRLFLYSRMILSSGENKRGKANVLSFLKKQYVTCIVLHSVGIDDFSPGRYPSHEPEQICKKRNKLLDIR